MRDTPMLFLPLLFLAQNHRYVKPTDTRELARVRAFMREAYTGLGMDEPIPFFEKQGEPTVDVGAEVERGERFYAFDYAGIHIDVTTGRILQYYGQGAGHDLYYPEGTLIPRRVTDADAAALARRFLAAAGFAGEIAVTQVQDLMGDNNQDVEIHYIKTAGGIPYDMIAETMDFERQTGILHAMGQPPFSFPAPPASLRPTLSLDAARAFALDSGAELRGEALAESPREGFRLMIWTPSATPTTKRAPGMTLQAKSATIRAALSAKRGILAYAGWLLGGSSQSAVRVVVDATTGEVLATQEPFSPHSTGGGGSGPIADAKSLAVPLTARPWRISMDQGALAGPVRAALLARSGTAPVSGRRIVLTDGAIAFPAVYDAKANLLGVAGKAYRPAPALAALLKRRAGSADAPSAGGTRTPRPPSG